MPAPLDYYCIHVLCMLDLFMVKRRQDYQYVAYRNTQETMPGDFIILRKRPGMDDLVYCIYADKECDPKISLTYSWYRGNKGALRWSERWGKVEKVIPSTSQIYRSCVGAIDRLLTEELSEEQQ